MMKLARSTFYHQPKDKSPEELEKGPAGLCAFLKIYDAREGEVVSLFRCGEICGCERKYGARPA